MKNIGIAPIGWTNDDLPELGGNISFEQCIDEMSKAGYTGTEVGNKYPKDPNILKIALEKKGLKVVNRWFSTFLISKTFNETFNEFKEQIDFLNILGAKRIGVSEQSYSIQGKNKPILNFDNKYIMNDDEWELLANGLNKLGEYALNKGIKLVYHHHMGTVVQTNYETDKLLKMTNEKYVFLLFDSGHYALSGANPANELKKHIKRVKHIHLKDVRTNKISDVKNKNMSFLDAVKFGIFTVPSDGNIDFQSIFNIIKDNNYNDWLLVEAEQDPAIANPFEMAKKAYKYIKKEFNNG